MTTPATRQAKPHPKKAAISASRTKALIVQSACDLIAEGGYDSLTAAALTARAGVSKGGLYHHFGGMADVAVAAYRQASQRVFGVLGTGSPKTFSDYLDEVEYVVFERLLADQKTLRVISELYPRLILDASHQQARKESFKTIMDKTSRVLNDSFVTKIDEEILRKAVNLVAAFVTGLAVQSRELRDVEESRQLWQLFSEALNDRVVAGIKPN
jgi:AcrR family transcriptional regulator